MDPRVEPWDDDERCCFFSTSEAKRDADVDNGTKLAAKTRCRPGRTERDPGRAPACRTKVSSTTSRLSSRTQQSEDPGPSNLFRWRASLESCGVLDPGLVALRQTGMTSERLPNQKTLPARRSVSNHIGARVHCETATPNGSCACAFLYHWMIFCRSSSSM